MQLCSLLDLLYKLKFHQWRLVSRDPKSSDDPPLPKLLTPLNLLRCILQVPIVSWALRICAASVKYSSTSLKQLFWACRDGRWTGNARIPVGALSLSGLCWTAINWVQGPHIRPIHVVVKLDGIDDHLTVLEWCKRQHSRVCNCDCPEHDSNWVHFLRSHESSSRKVLGYQGQRMPRELAHKLHWLSFRKGARLLSKPWCRSQPCTTLQQPSIERLFRRESCHIGKSQNVEAKDWKDIHKAKEKFCVWKENFQEHQAVPVSLART